MQELQSQLKFSPHLLLGGLLGPLLRGKLLREQDWPLGLPALGCAQRPALLRGCGGGRQNGLCCRLAALPLLCRLPQPVELQENQTA